MIYGGLDRLSEALLDKLGESRRVCDDCLCDSLQDLVYVLVPLQSSGIEDSRLCGFSPRVLFLKLAVNAVWDEFDLSRRVRKSRGHLTRFKTRCANYSRNLLDQVVN